MSLRSSHWFGWRSNKPGSRVSEEALWTSIALCVWFCFFSSLVGNAWTSGESINATFGVFCCVVGFCFFFGFVFCFVVFFFFFFFFVLGFGLCFFFSFFLF